MPILQPTNLDINAVNSPGSSLVTNSITPSPNALVLVTVYGEVGSGQDNTPTISGCNLIFVEIAQQPSSGGQRKTTMFRALGQAPTAGVLTIDFAGQNQNRIGYIVDEVTKVDTSGVNGSGAVVQSNTNGYTNQGSGTFSVTLNPFSGANNGTYGIASSNTGETYSPGTGFTQVAQRSNGDVKISEFAPNNQTTVSFTGGGGQYIELIAIEIKAANLVQGGMT